MPLARESHFLYALGDRVLNDPRRPEALRGYRERAEQLVRRAHELHARFLRTGDPALRAELRELEERRRDLWIDAGQAAREDARRQAEAGLFAADEGLVSFGIGAPPDRAEAANHTSTCPPCGSGLPEGLKRRPRTKTGSVEQWSESAYAWLRTTFQRLQPAGTRLSLTAKIVLFLSPVWVIYLPVIVAAVAFRILYGP